MTYNIDNFIPKINGWFDFTRFQFNKFNDTLKNNYTTYMVDSSEENLPDLISYKAYETENLWWIILLANKLDTFMDLKAGMIIKIPNRYFVDNFINNLSDFNDTSNTEITSVVLK